MTGCISRATSLNGDSKVLLKVLEVFGLLCHLLSKEIVLSFQVKDLLGPVLLLQVLKEIGRNLKSLSHIFMILLGIFHVRRSYFELGLIICTFLLRLSKILTE